MVKRIVRVTPSKKEALEFVKIMNADFKKRNIKREGVIIPVSRAYVRTLTRKGYPVPKRNYGVYFRNKK